MKKSMNDLFTANTARFYAFAYTLIQDELQAGQLVIDGISTSLKKHQELISRLSDEKANILELRRFFIIDVMQSIFEIASKRHEHMIFAGERSLSQSAIEFLLEREVFYRNEIAEITGATELEIARAASNNLKDIAIAV